MLPIRLQKLALGLTMGLLGVLASTLPGVLEFEENVGLDWLFLLRGPIEPPDDVVVVSIDSESATALNLPPDPDRWPRTLHAELVRRLSAAGVAVIVFDIIFDSPREEAVDSEFSQAVREAENVVLLERLRIETVETENAEQNLQVETRVPPIPALQRAALATGPFPLPRVPVKVSQFWVFGPSNPNVLTLPAMALHAYLLEVHDDFLSLLDAVRPGTSPSIAGRSNPEEATSLSTHSMEIRRLVQSNPGLTEALQSRLLESAEISASSDIQESSQAMLAALVDLYASPNSRYLNFYGPVRSISTVPYHLIISGDWEPVTSDLEGKVIFVGFSEQHPIDQQDEFYTAFSDRTGSSLSGVEIGATAFANLLETSSVHPLPIRHHHLLILSWGIAIMAVLLWLPTHVAFATVIGAGAGYIFLASQLFRDSGIWLPILIPVFGQIPIALLSVFAWKYAHAEAQRAKAKRTLSFYLPPQVVDQLSHESPGNRPKTQLLHGTCLVTDAERYTSLSERLQPQELHGLLNEYYGVLFSEVEKGGGFVSDVVGDSMVAMWANTEPDPAAGSNACRTAIAILRAVEQFNSAHMAHQLPTRIGIHSGQVLLGDIGAKSHFEYRAVGDIVNTASRIQGLNKHLRTNFLVSEKVLEETDYVFSRQVGKFVLAGKSVPLILYDLIELEGPIPPQHRELVALFSVALKSFHARNWKNAEKGFNDALSRFPTDGPSEFYLGLCRKYMTSEPGPSWHGEVVLSEK